MRQRYESLVRTEKNLPSVARSSCVGGGHAGGGGGPPPALKKGRG
jgi:hypothetical protein